MAFHRGNAFFTDVTADDLRTEWTGWYPVVDDEYATLLVDPLTHTRYFNTRNLAIVSVYLTATFSFSTPSPYSRIALLLPETLRLKADTTFRNQGVVERLTSSGERKFSLGLIVADAKEGPDRIFLDNLGQYIAGQTYTIKGQIVVEPAV